MRRSVGVSMCECIYKYDCLQLQIKPLPHHPPPPHFGVQPNQNEM